MQLTAILPLGILATGFLGSAHCAGMCGPLILASTTSLTERILYNLGRLNGYLALGAVMGQLGQFIFQNTYKNLQILGAIVIGSLLVLYGIQNLLNRSFFKKSSSILSTFLIRILTRIHRLPISISTLKTYLFGLASAFLPCGFLYSVALGAVLTENSLHGAVILLFFWVGTLPVMIAAPALLQHLFKRIPWLSPKLVSLLFIICGFVVFFIKLQTLSSPQSCCGH